MLCPLELGSMKGFIQWHNPSQIHLVTVFSWVSLLLIEEIQSPQMIETRHSEGDHASNMNLVHGSFHQQEE